MQLLDALRARGLTVFAAALLALFAVEILSGAGFAGERVTSMVMAAALAGSFAVARRAVLVPLVVAVALVPLSDQVVRAFADSGAFMVGILAAVFLVGRRADRRDLVVGVVLVVAAVPLAVSEDGEAVTASDVAFFAVFFGGPLLVGLALRRSDRREEVLAVRAREAERERDAAVLEERLRIARELHDIVSHSLNVILLQARGGRSVLASTPNDAAAAFDAIEYLGQQGLSEMRRMLGMLREDDATVPMLPQPSLSRLDELVDQVSACLPVTVEVTGTPVRLPASLDVSAYRIVQEGLTNALKHAGRAGARVSLAYTPETLELAVEDDGTATAVAGEGHGLSGLRERVSLYGGTLHAGPRTEGGFELRVRLPIPAV